MLLQNPIKKSKREIHLERELTILGFTQSLKALKLIKAKMSKGKFVRHDGQPYYLHCVDVTLHLINMGFRDGYEDLLTASLLHDYVEDVDGMTVEHLEETFNPVVAHTVFLVTKKKGVNYKENTEEFKTYLVNILTELFATLIKVSDRLCNFTTMSHSSLNHRKAQVFETKTYYMDFIKLARENYVAQESFFYTAELTFKALIFEYERYFNDIAE